MRRASLGGALYMGRLHREARRFLRTHREALATRPLAVFAMGDRMAPSDARDWAAIEAWAAGAATAFAA
jgi:hypothetical protein